MSGIVGYFNFDRNKAVSIEILEKLIDAIKHRGPDAEMNFVVQNVAFGYCHLKISGLNQEQQAMKNNDGTLIISFDGNIYNSNELRKELEKKNHQFLTDSDFEVILASYKEWNIDCVQKFNGIWAFAIYDRNERKMFCSRDRMGVKPFYYLLDKSRFVFSSEIKTFNFLNDFVPELDKNVLWDNLVFGPKSYGDTYIKGIKELAPGTNLIAKESGSVDISEYFRLEQTFQNQTNSVDIEYIEYLLLDAIKLRLISGEFGGTINSGGLDSSIISAVAKKYKNDLKTYSVFPVKTGTKMQHGDESYYAELLSKHIDSEHGTVRYDEKMFYSNLEHSINANDGELYHSHAVALNIMCREIRKNGIAFVLSGEGADEIFRGYTSNHCFNIIKLGGNYIGRKLLEKLFPNKEYLYNIVDNLLRALPLFTSTYVSPETLKTFLQMNGEMHPDRVKILEKMSVLSPENALCFYEQKVCLAGLLRRNDRMGMFNQVEIRVPFLDNRIVEELNKICFQKKAGLFKKSGKKILRKISRKYVPNEITHRKKFGFSTPLKAYESYLINRLNEIGVNMVPDNVNEVWMLNSILRKDLLMSLCR